MMGNRNEPKGEPNPPADWALALKWRNERDERQAQAWRAELLGPIQAHVQYACDRTKPHLGPLSPGCQSCSSGTWSWLLITPRCTATCPGCPQNPQTREKRPPEAEGLRFERARDYADYLERFGFRATGLCGGEPFMVFDTLADYIRTLKERFGDHLYVYVYTNGQLVTRSKLRTVAEAGLDEIRFNISARDYVLDHIADAVELLPRATVEVPAIPEDFATLRDRLPTLAAMGVAHVNVHQLFATRFNYQTFIDRGYTAVQGDGFDQRYLPGPGILESERTALRLLRHVHDSGLELPFNYCSQRYKNLYQVRGFRTRPATQIPEEFEDLTAAGYIRRLSLPGSAEDLQAVTDALRRLGGSSARWRYDAEESALHIHSTLLSHIDSQGRPLMIRYFDCQLADPADLPGEHHAIPLNENRSLGIQRMCVGHFRISSPSGMDRYRKLCLDPQRSLVAVARIFMNRDLERPDGSRPAKAEARAFLAAEPNVFPIQ